MKALFYLIISVMFIFNNAYAQDSDKVSINTCPGTWVLQYYGAWSVRNNDGTVLPLTPETVFFDCQKKEFRPSQDFHGNDVEIECLQNSTQTNLPNVNRVFFICR